MSLFVILIIFVFLLGQFMLFIYVENKRIFNRNCVNRWAFFHLEFLPPSAAAARTPPPIKIATRCRPAIPPPPYAPCDLGPAAGRHPPCAFPPPPRGGKMCREGSTCFRTQPVFRPRVIQHGSEQSVAPIARPCRSRPLEGQTAAWAVVWVLLLVPLGASLRHRA